MLPAWTTRTDRTFRGRLVETAVGAHLVATAGPDVRTGGPAKTTPLTVMHRDAMMR
jgi:hypothetical protein